MSGTRDCEQHAVDMDIAAADLAAAMLVGTVTTGAEEEREAIAELYRMFYTRLLEYRMHRAVALFGAVFRAWRILWADARATATVSRA